MSVSLAGWVDRGGFSPNAGQFPIRVERHLNRFVAAHLPGVTTVTAGTRYYALHGLVAQTAADQGLTEDQTIRLLRRAEVLLAYVTHVHGLTSPHPSWVPSPHGIDRLLRTAVGGQGLDLEIAQASYSVAKWGFSGAYRGSELTLKILDNAGFQPGEWFDQEAASSVLRDLIDLARGGDRHVTSGNAHDLVGACLCSTPTAADGRWLSSLLSGDAQADLTKPTLGGLLWQFGHLAAIAMTVADITDANSLGDRIMFDLDLREHPALVGHVGPPRWRGALFRKESVYSWRLIWRHLNDMVGGARPVDELIAAFADQLPAVRLGDFVGTLPACVDGLQRPHDAERQLGELPELERWLAVLILGSQRLQHLTGEERRGFYSALEVTQGLWEELTPGWFAEQVEQFRDRPMRELGRALATTLVNRSQRVALWKSRYDPRTQVLSYPARLRVRDGVAVRVYEETAPVPATRIPQYLSIAQQAGMFSAVEGEPLRLGPNGASLV